MTKWENNDIQFSRLLAEIKMAGGLTNEQMHAISESTDLTWNEINELFQRALERFDEIKASI